MTNYAEQVAELERATGIELTPWQRDLAATMLEARDNDIDLVVLIQRRNGRTAITNITGHPNRNAGARPNLTIIDDMGHPPMTVWGKP